VLVVAGRVIASNLRKMDVAARYGGDEFILLLPHASAEDAAAVAARIHEEYRTAVAGLLTRSEKATMSIGVGSRRFDDPSCADHLVAAADAALYKAKAAGRDRIVISRRALKAVASV
jgi:two-component system, cell cycle response regulator